MADLQEVLLEHYKTDTQDLTALAESASAEYRRKLAENDLLKQVVFCLRDPTVVVDSEKKILLWNKASLATFGLSFDAGPEDLERCLPCKELNLDRVFSDGVTSKHVVEVASGGVNLALDLHVAPIGLAGEVIAVLISWRAAR